MPAGASSDLRPVPRDLPGSAPAAAPAASPAAVATASVPTRPTSLVLLPFRALRPAAADPAQVTSPPYDVIDADGVAALEAADEHNVVRLILPRDEPDRPGDRYARAARLLEQWRDEGVLRPDDAPGLYVYEQADPGGHVQRGLLGALALTPAEDGIVLPHENTMAGPVSDRLALYTAVGADLEPIFLLYDGGGAASRAVAEADRAVPLVDTLLPDGLRHRLWAMTDPAQLDAIAADLAGRVAVIADGHHRYATYLQRQAERHAAGDGAGPWDTGLTFMVDAQAFGPEVHAIHRVVPGRSVEELAGPAASAASVRDLDGGDLPSALAELAAAGEQGAAFLLASGDRLALVSDLDTDQVAAALPAERSAAWRALDIAVLHGFLIPTVWGLPDTVETVRYEHAVADALATAARTAGTAVLLNPTPVEAVVEVAAAGERMPRKSTLFTPKPRTGLVLRDHRDA